MEENGKTPITGAEIESAEQAPQKYEYLPMQKWLLLGVLAMGCVWRLIEIGGATPVWYCMFWLLGMGIFTGFLLKQNPRMLKDPTVALLGIAAIVLCVLLMVRFRAKTIELTDLLMLSIPAVMLLYLAFAATQAPVKREGLAAREAIRSVFAHSFMGIPRFFGAIGGLFRGERGVWKRALIGAGVAIPLTALITFLLMQADGNMARLFGRLFADLPIGEWIAVFARILIVAMLFYGVFFHAIWREQKTLPPLSAGTIPSSTLGVVIIPLLVVYAVYMSLQFSYLFGGMLPEELTYSEYAREGFAQLNLVAAINFTLFGITRRYAPKRRYLDVLSGLLLVFTGLIVASCLVRLFMYIGAYGLTIRRIMSTWLAVYLAALTALCGVRLVKTTLPVLRIGGLLLVYWFVLLNVPDWNAWIVSFNAARF